MIRRLTATLTFAGLLALAMTGQQRGTSFNGTTRAPQPIERTEAAQAHRITAPVMPRGLQTTGFLHDAFENGRRYTATPARRVLGDGTTLYGSIIYSDSWVGSGARYGIYSFKADAEPSVTPVLLQGSYPANGGGTYADGKYYYNSYVYTQEMGYTFSTFITVDLATGESTKVTQSFIQGTFDQSQITHDLTYDSTTGTIYAIAYIKETDETGLIERFRPALSTLDTYTGFATPIAATPSLIALACNKTGELYGISKGAASTLYRINKETAECTAIGRTGLNPEYVQSATFDPVTGKLYWAETQLDGTTGLYEVDLSTGLASPITKFDDNQEFTGIYIPDPVVAPAAPAAAIELHTDFADGALKGAVCFTVPTITHGGGTLSGTVVADVEVDGKSYATLDCRPGEKCRVEVELPEGIHSYTVMLANESGESARTGMAWYVGIDAPAAPGNVQLSPGSDGAPVITWTAPEKGRNGGYIDPAQITYTITRMPEDVVVASGIKTTTYTDRSSFDSGKVYYTVTAYCGKREGHSASTGEGVFGQGSQLPVTFDFDTEDDFNQCTVVDANHDWDGEYHWGGWIYAPTFSYTAGDGACAVYLYSPENAADDWLFMAPFTATAGKLYRVSFKLWTRGERETLAVTAGNLPTPETQSEILAATNYTNKEAKDYSVEFRAKADGNCFIGFHCTSARKRYYLFIDHVSIDEVPDTGAPAAVSDLSVTPGEHGALSAQISLTAPSKTAGGQALTSLERIDIFRGNERTAIHSFTSPAPAAKLSWTDAAPVQGFNTYRAVAYNASGAGEKALATEYIGYDLPTACTEVTLREEDGKAVLRWQAPEEGQNGGFIDSGELIFRIVRNDGTLISSHAKGTEFIDTSVNGAQKQHFLYYQIEAISAAGVGDYALSNHIIYGEPYKGDFFESFADVATQNDPWVMYRIKGNTQLWTLQSQGYTPSCYAADNDGGMAVFSSTNGRIGDEGRMVSPKLSIKDMNVPVFAFAFYHNPDEATINGDEPFVDRMIPEIGTPDGTYTALDEPIYVDDPRYSAGWYLYTYDLSDFKDREWIQLSFHGFAGYQNDVYVDYVSLESNVHNDLAAYTLSGPSGVKAGRSAKFRFTVLNQGMLAAENYTARLLRDGKELQTTTGKAIGSGEFASFDFAVPATAEEEGKTYAYTAEIVLAGDELPGNNAIVDPIRCTVLSPDVPEVRSLSGTVKEKAVNLSWNDADALHVNDSFETYQAFAIEDVGDYTLIDGDKGYTYTFNDINFDYSGDQKGFQVFNPYTLYIAMLPEWQPHSGTQLMAAFSACDNYGKAIDSNDWLITPELIGGTEVVFWAKTANYEWGFERFRPMYSTGGTDMASFRPLAEAVTTGKDWTEYRYTLPADARYFAVNYISNDGYVFYLDDLSYTARCTLEGASLSGFRVYRNGVAIAELGADARSFTDSNLDDGTYTYAVTALFGTRESKRVETAVQVGQGGMNDAEVSSLKVSAGDRCIVIEGAEGAEVSVANVAGITLFASSQADSYRVAVDSGVYVVRAGDKVIKVIVK